MAQIEVLTSIPSDENSVARADIGYYAAGSIDADMNIRPTDVPAIRRDLAVPPDAVAHRSNLPLS